MLPKKNVPLYATERTASPGEFPVLAVLFCARPLRCCELVVGLLDAPVSHTFFGGDFGLILVFVFFACEKHLFGVGVGLSFFACEKQPFVTCLVFLLGFGFIENKFLGFCGDSTGASGFGYIFGCCQVYICGQNFLSASAPPNLNPHPTSCLIANKKAYLPLRDDMLGTWDFLQQPDDEKRNGEDEHPDQRHAHQSVDRGFIDVKEFIEIKLYQRMDYVDAKCGKAKLRDDRVRLDARPELLEQRKDEDADDHMGRAVMLVVEFVEFAFGDCQVMGAVNCREVCDDRQAEERPQRLFRQRIAHEIGAEQEVTDVGLEQAGIKCGFEAEHFLDERHEPCKNEPDGKEIKEGFLVHVFDEYFQEWRHDV